ncbi:hypothetical protein [Nocardia sp. CDC160]|uniref:hypothetical protein n=1 Tax=Nocardia sp. CDC160 TaxID=3112166 RepID=UPI002DBFB814|nr:hypothetical protein [Nocardia sp. CDC160]MEC3917910.1 hypothetical protein [Nocardia sp. CDC160]
MTRYRTFRAAKLAGHAFWWLFLVSTLLSGNYDWTAHPGQPRRYADYVPSDGFDPLGPIQLAAFCLVILAAVVEAVAIRRPIAGVLTIVIPFVSAILIHLALPRGYTNDTLAPIPALVLILAAVAIRELWERDFAPRMNSSS